MENDLQELVGQELESELSFDVRLKEWLDVHNRERITPQVYLYKFDNPKSGNEKALISKFEEDIPDAHSVGLQYGSGRYLVLVTTPATKTQKQIVRGYRFRVHEHYDKIRSNDNVRQGSDTPLPLYNTLPVVQTSNPMSEGLGMIKEVLGLVLPIIAASRSNQPDMGSFMAKQYSQMGDIMKHNLIESGKLMADAMRTKLSDNSLLVNEVDEPEENSSIIEQVLPYIKEFIPALIGNGPASTATAKMVQTLPQFKQVVNNRNEVKRLISYLDESQGSEITDKVLKKFKISR